MNLSNLDAPMAHLTVKQILDAIPGSAGIYSAIGERLGVTRQAIHWRASHDEEIAKAIAEERESALDVAESQLMTLIREGDGASVRFFLSTIGRNRGYTSRQEVSAELNGIGTVHVFLPHNGRDSILDDTPPTPNLTNQEPSPWPPN